MKFFMKNEDKNVIDLLHKLLKWYQRNKRDLPWRRTKDPYAILVSEVMLQQTKVNVVIPYYERWIKRWPDLKSLSESKEEDVIKAWEGLGYYARARSLHSIALELKDSGNFTLPKEIEDLKRLPGVGEYTACAVASIAYGKRVAAIDGNIRRVIGRMLGENINSKGGKMLSKIRAALKLLLPTDGRLCGDFNQALMDLGALICKPRDPVCSECPWEKACVWSKQKAKANKDSTGIRRNKICEEKWAWIEKQGHLWCQAPSVSRLPRGLWSLPQFKSKEMRKIKELAELRFSISNRKVHVKLYLCEWKKKSEARDGGKWLSIEEIQKKPFSAASRKFMMKIGWTP
jgi:A/G-specific adenine glycosylase